MNNITLISTTHSESGKCTSDELYKIIESINPKVIFEELTIDLFDKIYNKHFPHNILEVKCIQNYINNHNIIHIPVDIDASPNLSNNEIHYMYDSFKKYHVYKSLEQEQNSLIELCGHAFLNSKKCSDLFDKKMQTEKYLLGFGTDKNNLIRIHNLFHEEQDKRESAILRNIYDYAIENPFSTAVFLIGAAHRTSLIQKINGLETTEELKLNWKLYNNNSKY